METRQEHCEVWFGSRLNMRCRLHVSVSGFWSKRSLKQPEPSPSNPSHVKNKRGIERRVSKDMQRHKTWQKNATSKTIVASSLSTWRRGQLEKISMELFTKPNHGAASWYRWLSRERQKRNDHEMCAIWDHVREGHSGLQYICYNSEQVWISDCPYWLLFRSDVWKLPLRLPLPNLSATERFNESTLKKSRQHL